MKLNLFRPYKVFLNKKYILYFLLYFVFFLAYGPLEKMISLLVVQLGFSESQYGVFLSVVTFTFIIAPSVISLLTDKMGPYVVSIFGMLLGLVGALVIGLNLFSSWVVFLFIYGILFSREAFNYSIGNIISASITEDKRSKFFSIRDLFLYGAISIGLFVGGYICGQYGLLAVYGVFALLYPVICTIIVFIRRNKVLKAEESTDTAEQGEAPTVKPSMKEKLKRLFKLKAFVGFALVDILTSFYGAAMNFIPILGLSLGIDIESFMTLVGVVTIVNAVGGLILGYFFESGRKTIYVLDLFVDLIPAVLFSFTNSIPVFVAAYILVLLKDVFSPISFAYFYDCFDESTSTLALGFLSSIGNTAETLMPMIVGILWAQSRSLVFTISAACIILATIVAVVLLPGKGSKRKAS